MKYRQDDYYIRKVLKGDVRAFAQLVEKHKDRAYTLALRIVRNKEDAEEITQDAFIRVYNSLKDFKGDARFSTWLYKIIYNSAISRFRKKKIDSFSMDDSPLKESLYEEKIDGLDLLHKSERKKIISAALDQLREDESAVLTLFYLNENSIKEIEEITGYTTSNIKILLFRGRKKLLSELKKSLKDEIVDIL